MIRTQGQWTVVKRLQVALLVLVTLVVGAASGAASVDPGLTVYFFDVDQGDATLFQHDDAVILVDAGRHDRSDLLPLLKAAGVTAIDLFVLTHPHSDHIGQCEAVMKNFPVREVWYSGDVHTSRTFERCIDAILASDAAYHEPRAGESFRFGPVRIDVVSPAAVTGDLNNGSLALRFTYQEVTFLLTGDAEAQAEQGMLERGHLLAADVLHLGHHGSSTSSTLAFLRAVGPEVAVYSAGRDNPYGHPHGAVLQRLAGLGVTVYGTDRHGTVTVATDGKEYAVITERKAEASSTAAVPEGCTAGQVNVNTASRDELTRIVNVGPVLAERIIAERPFLTLDDLLRVNGIGEARLAQIKGQGLACAGPFE